MSLVVELVFALAESQFLEEVSVEPGAAVADVVKASGVEEQYPQVNFSDLPVGIWGREVPRSQVVRDGDRVEIYRPLAMDPRDARRRLARAGRTMGGGSAD